MSADMALPNVFGDVARFASCEQCGRCSSACPRTGLDAFNIRRILRHVELGLADRLAATDTAWACTTCARCETACPNGIAILDIVRSLRRLAIEAAPRDPVPCIAACPAGIDVPGYLRFIADGEPQKAYELILEAAFFPGVLGRVCPHPCEPVCRRGEVNQPVASDRALAVAPDTGRKVAVVGSGPAGLAAAACLRRKGHAVAVFEARAEPGGMMRWGIPRYRLPLEVLEKEIQQVLDLGVALETGVALGKELALETLRNGFDAVFLALGLQKSRRIELPGSENKGVSWGLDFLAEVAGGDAPKVEESVLVIGGGDVAVDVACSALRLGARSVTMACLESREEMPAHTHELALALEEGVALVCGWGPLRVLADDGRVTGLEMQRCSSVFDEEGRFDPQFTEERMTLGARQLILAVGQAADQGFVEGDMTLVQGLLEAATDTGETTVRGVFAGGEIATGPGSLVDAIASGKRVAAAIDRFLGGDGELEPAWAERPDTAGYDGTRELGFADRERPDLPETPLSERQTFAEVASCLQEDLARREASRCLSCDLEAQAECLRRG
jgi:NADPH-dependent glutamate synthase beta subunit-like oxidoreductase